MRAIIFLAALLAGTAQAASYSGNELLSELNGTPMQRFAGIRYIKGAWDGIELTQQATQQRAICVPNEVLVGQVVEIVTGRLSRSPEIRHEEAVFFVYGALVGTWPCKATPQKQRGQAL